MTELKIKQKYFDAILKWEKPFEIRHRRIKEDSLVKLTCIENNRYIIFKADKSEKINQIESTTFDHGVSISDIINEANENSIKFKGKMYRKNDSWYDDFCWKYIQQKDSYIIPIKEIIEVK